MNGRQMKIRRKKSRNRGGGNESFNHIFYLYGCSYLLIPYKGSGHGRQTAGRIKGALRRQRGGWNEWELTYDSEQEELSERVRELEKNAIADREQLSSIEQFAEHISDYAGITELDFPVGLIQ